MFKNSSVFLFVGLKAPADTKEVGIEFPCQESVIIAVVGTVSGQAEGKCFVVATDAGNEKVSPTLFPTHV